jgi:diguanylate cyclase (GGDEF)-like protein/PAS domain S-box-containing protein
VVQLARPGRLAVVAATVGVVGAGAALAEGPARPWAWAALQLALVAGLAVAWTARHRSLVALARGLEARRHHLEQAQGVAGVGSWGWELGPDRMAWSAELYRLLGQRPGAAAPSRARLLAAVHPHDRPLLDASVRSVAEFGTPFAVDVRVVAPGGEVRWLDVRGAVGRREGGRVVAVAGTLQDVTDRRRREGALAQDRTRVRAVVEAAADGVLVVDRDGRVVTFNQRFVAMWGIPRRLVTARDAMLLLTTVVDHVRDPQGFLRRLRDVSAHPECESFDVVEFADGRVFERDARPHVVEGVVEGAVLTFRDVTEARTIRSQLEHQAFHDALTGLPNQVLFRDRVDHALARSHRADELIAVLYLDIDNFKTVNDSLGHPGGDDLLVLVAERLRACLRAADTIARLSGDEFAVLVEGVSRRRDVLDAAERVLEQFHRPFVLGDEEVAVSTSVGIAFAGPGATSSEVLIRNADMAMYEAKGGGKDRYRVFKPFPGLAEPSGPSRFPRAAG